MEKTGIDFIVPVYNSLEHARVCLESIWMNATGDWNLFVINDASDIYTSLELRKLVQKIGPRASLMEHSANRGYLKSVNEGIALGAAGIVVLVNSDAALSAGATDRLRTVFGRDERIAIVNPVSTWANWTRVPFAAGSNRLSLSDIVRRLGSEEVSDIGNASGFFFAVRRDVYNRLGLFDEAFDPGYWEEADFCMRVLDAGLRVVVDTKLYIYHHGWASFKREGRDVHMNRNRSLFMERWSDKFARLESRWRKDNPASKLSEALENNEKFLLSEQTSVCFIAGHISAYNSSIYQLANALINKGVNAGLIIVSESEIKDFIVMPMYFRPLHKKKQNILIDEVGADIYVSIDDEGDSIIRSITSGKSIHIRIFDYNFNKRKEPGGYFNYRNLADVVLVRNNYEKAKVENVFGNVQVLKPGIDRDVFYYKKSTNRSRIVLDGTAQGGFDQNCKLEDICRLLSSEIDGYGIDLIGAEAEKARMEGEIRYHSCPRYSELADILNEAMVFIDTGIGGNGILYQLAAMACGAIPIINVGLANTEIVKHRYNCIFVRSDEEIVVAVKKLIDDQRLREALVSNGIKTVQGFSSDIEALEFRGICEEFRSLRMEREGPSKR